MNSLERALINLVDILSANNIPYMIIGGMENAVWGEPRSTIYIDVTIWLGEENTDRIVSILSVFFHPLVHDPSKFALDTNVFPLESKDGVRVDLIFERLAYEKEAIERSVEINIEGSQIGFCTPEDLILHKIISGLSLTNDVNHCPDMLISCFVNVTSVSQDKTPVICEYLEKFFTVSFKPVYR